MSNICELCGKEKQVYLKSVEKREGGRTTLYLCDSCRGIIESNDEWVETAKGYVRSNPMVMEETESDSVNTKNKWTLFVKGLNGALFIALMIIGCVFGVILGNMLSYDSSGAIIGGFVGAIVGAVFGGIIVSFSMMLVEISLNIGSILDEIKKEK